MSGYQLLVVGCSGPIVSACSRKWGKRPCLFISSVFALAGTIIGSATSTFDGLLASRIVQGFSSCAYESLIISTVGDLYFVHQRGVYMAATLFLLTSVTNFSSIICGAILSKLGWRYLFHIMNACLGLQVILLYLLCPETTYNRDRRYESDKSANNILDELTTFEREPPQVSDETGEKVVVNLVKPSTAIPPPPAKTFRQELTILTGTYSHENIFGLIIAPIAICTNVVILCKWLLFNPLF